MKNFMGDWMKSRILFVLFSSFSMLSAQAYCAGDQINTSDLNNQYEVCYGSGNYETGDTWTLSDYDGSQSGSKKKPTFETISAECSYIQCKLTNHLKKVDPIVSKNVKSMPAS